MTKFLTFLTLFLTLSLPAGAEEPAAGPLALHYSLYVGGMKVVDVDVRYQLSTKLYDIRAEGRTKGFWRTLVPWRTNVWSRGGLDAATDLTPALAVYDTMWRDKLKSIRMEFKPNGDVTATSSPYPFRPDGRVEATADDIRGSLDPLSAVVAVLAKSNSGESACKGKIQSFDGRRVYNLVLTSKGPEELAANRYSMFSGAAERCQITFKPVAGFPQKDERSGFWSVNDNRGEKSPLTIWLAKVSPEGPVVPVRVQSDGTYGAMIAHLRTAEPYPTAQASAAK